MAIELVPLPLPESADASKFSDFGREVKNLNPGTLSPEQFKEIEQALYTVRNLTHHLLFGWVLVIKRVFSMMLSSFAELIWLQSNSTSW